MKPTWRDVLLLVALQFGACVAIALLLALLRINDGSNSWVGLVGGIMGAQVFTILRERRRPGLVACSDSEKCRDRDAAAPAGEHERPYPRGCPVFPSLAK